MFINYYWFFLLILQIMWASKVLCMAEGGMPQLLHELETKKQEYELSRIGEAFSSIDELFSKSIIKIQKLNSNQEVIEEQISDLYSFLTGPHEISAINEKIRTSLTTSLPDEAYALLQQSLPQSFLKAVQLLWEKKYLSKDVANELIIKVSPMTAEETIRLVENGACLSESGYLVLLRTGSTYGEALKLDDDVEALLRHIKEEKNIALPNVPILSLLDGPHREHVIGAFSRAGMSMPDAISDVHVLREMRKYFIFLSTIGRITWLRPGGVGSPSVINPVDATYIMLAPQQISAILIGNHYFQSINASMNHALAINPLGINYSGSMSFDNQGADWWLSYSDGYLGAGVDYTINFDQGTMWSNGQASYLSMGVYAGGWKNRLSAGISMTTLLASSIGAGASASISVFHDHDVAYLGPYPLDGKFAAIRGLHKVEITDKQGIGLSGAVAMNFSGAQVPLAVAFKAGVDFTRARTYRTHRDMKQTQKMLKEGGLHHLLYKNKDKIKETNFPRFEHPEVLIDGDELVEVKTGKLNGAFVVGLQSFGPIYAARIGASIDLTAEFELGLRRLPNDKFEVSIEPRRVHEMSLFASMLNTLGAGQVKSIAIARKQIFIFDFKRPEARLAYFELIHQGRLPSIEEIEVSTEDRGPEYFLAEFRAQNVTMRKRGVERIYMEAISIDTAKSYAGFNAPIIPAALYLINKTHNKARKNHRPLNLRFEGLDREFLRSYADTVATNGLIAVRRVTSGGRISHGQGFSGRYNQDLFVTNRRVHSIDEKPNGTVENTWQFDSIIIHAQLEDTIITGNEENEMAEMVNNLFSTYIGSFEYKNSKAPRVISLERELSRRELAELLTPEVKDRVAIASQASGIEQTNIYALLKILKNKHPDQQGMILKQFVEGNKGFSGFAAIHQLLGARPEDISVETESGYMNVIQNARTFIAAYSNLGSTNSKKVNLLSVKSKKNKKHIKRFYQYARVHLREIDQQLRLLYDDQYLIDENSPLNIIYGKEKVQELIKAGMRQDKTAAKSGLISARKTILELMNLEAQGFSLQERLAIYRSAKHKRLRLVEDVELLLNKTHDLTDKKTRLIFVDLLDKINLRLIKLNEDQIMKAMDLDYVDSQSALWRMLSAKLEKIISAEQPVSFKLMPHLDSDQAT